MIFTKHQLHQEKFKPTQGQCQWVLFYFKKKDCSITYSGTKSEDYESLYKEIFMKISKFKIPNFKKYDETTDFLYHISNYRSNICHQEAIGEFRLVFSMTLEK